MVKETAGQRFLITTMIYLDIVSDSHSNPAEYYQVLFTVNIVILV